MDVNAGQQVDVTEQRKFFAGSNPFDFIHTAPMEVQTLENVKNELIGEITRLKTENENQQLEIQQQQKVFNRLQAENGKLKKAKSFENDPEIQKLGTCMVKTHLSLSHDPNIKGRPKGWTLPVKDIMIYKGAGFIVPVAGDIKLMPGTASNPAFRNIDVDVETGKVKGLF